MTSLRVILIRVLNVIGLAIGIVLALRILLAFFAANSAAPIVSWIYAAAAFLTYPFRGIFSDIVIPSTGGVVDVSAFIALLAYGIVISVLNAFIDAVFRPLLLSRDRGHAHVH